MLRDYLIAENLENIKDSIFEVDIDEHTTDKVDIEGFRRNMEYWGDIPKDSMQMGLMRDLKDGSIHVVMGLADGIKLTEREIDDILNYMFVTVDTSIVPFSHEDGLVCDILTSKGVYTDAEKEEYKNCRLNCRKIIKEL